MRASLPGWTFISTRSFYDLLLHTGQGEPGPPRRDPAGPRFPKASLSSGPAPLLFGWLWLAGFHSFVCTFFYYLLSLCCFQYHPGLWRYR